MYFDTKKRTHPIRPSLSPKAKRADASITSASASFRRVKCMHTKHTFACARTFHQAFFVRAAPKTGGELLVGLLTYVSRRPKNRHCISVAFPAKPLRPPVTCFRRKRIHSTNTAIELHVCRNFRLGCCCKTCSGLSPDSLVQQNKDACPFHDVERVAHLPQKPDVIFSFRFMHRLRRFPHTATL